jgi:hypothetical protein
MDRTCVVQLVPWLIMFVLQQRKYNNE